jgi:hypothetical protein
MSTKVFVAGPHNVLAALIRLMRRPSMSSPLFFGERILAIWWLIVVERCVVLQ